MTSRKSDESTLLLLRRAVEAFRSDLDSVLGAQRGAPPELLGLAGSQRRLLTLVPAEGARGTELATSAGMTKQALGELAASLASAGLLTAVADPTDRRARLWRLTPAGKVAAEAARRAVALVESRWRDALGARDYDRLVGTLRLVQTLHDAIGRSA